MPLKFRFDVKDTDPKTVRGIVESTGFFEGAPDEIDIAEELCIEALRQGQEKSGYHFIFAEENGKTVGYACLGPVACTVGTFDLYWIAVHKSAQKNGIGVYLMQEAEKRIEALGGKRIFIETSGRPQYVPTRSFYLKCDYKEQAILKNYYTDGDDCIIFGKDISLTSRM